MIDPVKLVVYGNKAFKFIYPEKSSMEIFLERVMTPRDLEILNNLFSQLTLGCSFLFLTSIFIFMIVQPHKTVDIWIDDRNVERGKEFYKNHIEMVLHFAYWTLILSLSWLICNWMGKYIN